MSEIGIGAFLFDGIIQIYERGVTKMSLDQMSGEQELVFSISGKEYKTGPLTLKHLRKLQRLFAGTQAETIAWEAAAAMLTLLFEDAKLIPGEFTEWDQKIDYVSDMVNLQELESVFEVINNAMPASMKQQVGKITGQQ